MHKVLFRPAARKDLKSIYRYTFGEWGERQAETYLDDLTKGILLLADNPKLGREREAVRSGYRSLQIREHIVYYVIEGEAVSIRRVLHTRMDPDHNLSE